MTQKCKNCGAVLSSYNPGPLCWPCQEKRKEQLEEKIGDTPHYTVENLCFLLGLRNPESVKRRGRKGLIPGRVPGIRQHLYRREEVNQWIKGPQEESTGGTQQQQSASFLTIQLREVGGTTADPESGKGGQLVAFTLGNCSRNVLTVERICLEVLSCQSYDEPPYIGARVIPLKYEVKLSPDRLGEYVITEDRFRYEGPGADDFDLVCGSPAGFKYNARLNIYYSDFATTKHLTSHSEPFDICFCRKGHVLSRYIDKRYARRLGMFQNGSSAV